MKDLFNGVIEMDLLLGIVLAFVFVAAWTYFRGGENEGGDGINHRDDDNDSDGDGGDGGDGGGD